jgi:chemotaxis protein CheX
MKSMTQQRSHGRVAFDPSWKALLEIATIEVFEMMAGVRLEVDPAPAEEKGEQTAMVGMAGALCGMTTIRCSRAASAKFASLMLGGDAASNPSTARDALGELCNMVAGNFKGKVNTLADQCMLSVPTVITGDDYSLSPLDPAEGATIALTYEGEPIWISLIIHS